MAAPRSPKPQPVVGPQFCKPHAVPLTVSNDALSLSDGDFTVAGDGGAVVLRVKGLLFSFGRHRVLLDAAGRPLLSMLQKVFSFHHQWQVFRGNSIDARQLLLTVKQSSLMQLAVELDVFLAGNTEEQVCDYKIKAGYFGRSCVFYPGNSNTIVAQMNRQLTFSTVFGRNTFGVTVFPNVDHVFIASLVVIVEEIFRSRQRARRARSSSGK